MSFKKITSNHILIVIGLVIVYLLLKGDGSPSTTPSTIPQVAPVIDSAPKTVSLDYDDLEVEATEKAAPTLQPLASVKPSVKPAASPSLSKPYSNEYFSVSMPAGYSVSTSGGGGKSSFSFSGPDQVRFKVSVGSGTISDQPELYKFTGLRRRIGGFQFKQYIYQGVSDYPYVYEYNGYEAGQGDFRIITVSASPDAELDDPRHPFWSSFSFKTQAL